MSISASIMGLIVLALGKIKIIPRRIICVLWAIPFLRMWIPIGISSKYSLMSLISKFTTKTVTVYSGDVEFSMMNHVMGAETYFPITYKIKTLQDFFAIVAVIWLVVALALIIAMTIIYCITKSELKDAAPLRDNIYISCKIATPATYGILRPKIILPEGTKESDLPYILMHERAHIKRLDNLWRIVAVVTACMHWFNPMSWLFLKSFLQSLELACDEAVLRNLASTERKEYATILLNCAESKNFYASAFGGTKVRVRIERILSYKKISAVSMIAFIAFAIAISYILLTNAQ